jgi:hypothetical protein
MMKFNLKKKEEKKNHNNKVTSSSENNTEKKVNNDKIMINLFFCIVRCELFLVLC